MAKVYLCLIYFDSPILILLHLSTLFRLMLLIFAGLSAGALHVVSGPDHLAVVAPLVAKSFQRTSPRFSLGTWAWPWRGYSRTAWYAYQRLDRY